jgi:hypothetical protein
VSPRTRGALLACAGLLLVDAITAALTRDVPYRSGVAVLARWAVLLLAGYVAAGARRGRWWAAPLAVAGGALVAVVLACLVGIFTGQFRARGFGPALVFALPIWTAAAALVFGLVAAAARTLVERRVATA